MPRRGSVRGGTAPTTLSDRDSRYIRTRFVALEKISAKCGVALGELRDWQTRGVFPGPTYVTPDHAEWYPPMLAAFVRRALSRKTDLRALFIGDFSTALAGVRLKEPKLYRLIQQDVNMLGEDDRAVADAYWGVYMGGMYGACLRAPWVPCIVRKSRLTAGIEELTQHPTPEDPQWGRRLRRLVDAMDTTEMPFAEWDRVRFGGPVSRDRYVIEIRKRFPNVFGATQTTES